MSHSSLVASEVSRVPRTMDGLPSGYVKHSYGKRPMIVDSPKENMVIFPQKMVMFYSYVTNYKRVFGGTSYYPWVIWGYPYVLKASNMISNYRILGGLIYHLISGWGHLAPNSDNNFDRFQTPTLLDMYQSEIPSKKLQARYLKGHKRPFLSLVC